MRIKYCSILLVSIAVLMSVTSSAAESQKMKMTTEIPPGIATPNRLETRIGTLNLFDGVPDAKTTQIIYDNLDFQRATQAFLAGMPIASMYA